MTHFQVVNELIMLKWARREPYGISNKTAYPTKFHWSSRYFNLIEGKLKPLLLGKVVSTEIYAATAF